MRHEFKYAIAIVIAAVFVSSVALADTTVEFRKTVPLSPGAPVTVDNVNGSITVSAWDSTYADIFAVKQSKYNRDEIDKVSIGMRVRPVFRRLGADGSSGAIFYGTKFVPAE